MSGAEAAAVKPALFTPFALRGVTFANRIIVSPMCQYAADDGYVGRWHRAHHGRFALSGVGGAIVESTGVMRDGRITPGCLGIYLDEHIAGLREITAIYREQQVPVGIQLSHAGRKGSAAVPLEGAQPLATGDPSRAWRIVAPSAEPLTPDWPVPHALDAAEIEEIIDAFVAAARRAVDAGFDFVEIHGAHGYLIHSFLSPIANRREDEWGGDLNARMRLPLEIARRVRGAIPDAMPIFYRASAIDGIEGGLTIEDSVALARELKAIGVDLVDCSSGGIHGASGNSSVPPSPGYLVEHAARIRRDADMPTMAVGLIVDAHQAEAIVAKGEADLVAMGRQLLAEPSFPYRAAQMLGVDDPAGVLPPAYAFFLRRRKIAS